ncbi:hypothetical protein Patl1_32008 [Pistacia atlantica]|uniref:Uncharacterized protein n=1 Tax=Pistacia atlantica TaxID=434234 RepID=A0ACC1ARM3_9ROSI|nr:hypothetical protein Patl1_32008 [Pistacia atlantica]
MNNQILSNVVSITLSQCENCFQLPPLWQLPCLRHLTIGELIHLEYIDTSFQGDKIMSKFPSLEELRIYQLPEATKVVKTGWKGVIPIEKLLRSILNFRSLTHLYVDSIPDSIYLPHGIVQTLTSLHEMRIMKFRKFKGFPRELVSLSTLKSLHIDLCPDFEAFPEQVLEGLTSLQLLDVRECRKFSTLSEGLQHLSALKCLVLNGCPELVALPDGTPYLYARCFRFRRTHGGDDESLTVLPMDRFAPCFYIAAATDNMSLQNARVFEDSLVHKNGIKGSCAQFMQIYRSREVGQSYITSVWTTLLAIAHALWLMIRIRPQGVLTLTFYLLCCVVVIAMLLKHFLKLYVEDTSEPLGHENRWSSVFYVESIAKVKRLSFSGLLLFKLCIADQFFVQWPQLQRKYPRACYVGCLL